MKYHEATNFLFDLRRFKSKPGTESTEDLLDHLGSPQEDLRCVQVAGSNGKGSVVRMTESICREHDLDTGRYTSPHFDNVRERVTVNGKPISESELVQFVESAGDYIMDRAANGSPLTFFEVVTAMAIWHFARRDVDVA
ncbi:MAG: dihydropteroate synthase, partial [Halobacteriaceae archaeon]